MDGADQFPTQAIGWTALVAADSPETCFPRRDDVCDASDATRPAQPTPDEHLPIDPQVGWEQQKFLIAWTLHVPAREPAAVWLDQLNIWELGADSDPGFATASSCTIPTGKRLHRADLRQGDHLRQDGAEGHLGPRPRVGATSSSCRLTRRPLGPDIDGDGRPDWYVPVHHATALRS